MDDAFRLVAVKSACLGWNLILNRSRLQAAAR